MRDLPPARWPFPVRAPHAVVPAPRPLGEAPHVVLDDAWPSALARRLERLAADRQGVLVRDLVHRDDPGLEAALREAWALLPDPSLLGVAVDGDRCVRTGPSASEQATELLLGLRGLELLAVGWLLHCSDDLVVLRRHGPGRLGAELLAVAFPSGWPPRRRAGASLLRLHAPVADGERLQRAAGALSEALLTKGPLLQHVWGLQRHDRLDVDPSAPDPPQPTPGWWFRSERQTSVPLPHLGRALFTIRPFVVPLQALDAEQREVLAETVLSMSPEALAYKGVAGSREDLLGELRGPSGRMPS